MMKVLMSALLATAIQLSVTHAACAGENLAQIKSAGVFKVGTEGTFGNDSNLLIVFYVQIMPDDFVMQLHR
ncbi:hypothetical protein ACUIG4_08780, partial [Raoultella ornithinolytica]